MICKSRVKAEAASEYPKQGVCNRGRPLIPCSSFRNHGTGFKIVLHFAGFRIPEDEISWTLDLIRTSFKGENYIDDEVKR